MNSQQHNPLDEIITPDELIKQHGDKFSQPQLSWWLRNRERNGLQAAGAVSMRGRKFFIHRQKFANWLIPQQA
jgi:hypothetical protein